VQAWINPDDTGDQRLFGKCCGTGSDDETFLLRQTGGSIGVRMRTDTNYDGGYDPGSLSTGSWQLVAATWDVSDHQLRVYRNGVEQGSTWLGGNTMYTSPSVDEPTLGNIPNGGRDYNGKMQEARLSKVARSADWFLTEYNNQSDPASFYSVGSGSCFQGSFTCNRKITVPQANVSGSTNLSEFPLLIKIENDCNLKTAANGGSVQNSNGWDIIFTDSGGVNQLDHELVSYDAVTGDLVAWVSTALSASSDTDIYMYYGNGAISCDPSNPAGVWNSNYKGVWHLEEDPATAGTDGIIDSTSNANHGTDNGSMNASDQVDGKIGKALDFDGSDDYLTLSTIR